MPPAKILVVEDESIVALDISLRLKRQGHDVLGLLAFGEDAVEQVATLCPDLILMDIRLQGQLDGIDAAQQILSKFDVPLIFLTAYSDNLTLSRAEKARPRGYLTKPFEESELKDAIDLALELRR
jgi:CheY-like chemotaxis protein